jgi:hypothetical protein
MTKQRYTRRFRDIPRVLEKCFKKLSTDIKQKVKVNSQVGKVCFFFNSQLSKCCQVDRKFETVYFINHDGTLILKLSPIVTFDNLNLN